jgi:ATP-dependent RNA helicase RhlE
MSTFAELGVSAPVCSALRKRGLHDPFKIQSMVLPDALAGRDVLAKSRTGSGKTLAFAIPIVERLEPTAPLPSALVLVPTRELAAQVTEELNALGPARQLRVAPVYGGVSLERQAQRAGKAHILIATPGRLEDLIRRRLLRLDKIQILILDEADRMLDMGFQPQVDAIVRRLPRDRQTMFFSATLDGRIGWMASAYTRSPVKHEITDSRPTVATANHSFLPVGQHGKVEALLKLLSAERGLTLVFVRTKRGAERLSRTLRGRGLKVEALHGDLTQGARQRALREFESGHADVLVATDVAARGLDLEAITHVINYDPPQDHTDYVHRVGRTARAGKSGAGVTLVTPQDETNVSAIATRLELEDEFQADGLVRPKPQLLYSSRRNRSSMRPRQKRRF